MLETSLVMPEDPHAIWEPSGTIRVALGEPGAPPRRYKKGGLFNQCDPGSQFRGPFFGPYVQFICTFFAFLYTISYQTRIQSHVQSHVHFLNVHIHFRSVYIHFLKKYTIYCLSEKNAVCEARRRFRGPRTKIRMYNHMYKIQSNENSYIQSYVQKFKSYVQKIMFVCTFFAEAYVQ